MSMTTREAIRTAALDHGWTLKTIPTPNGAGKDVFSIGSTVVQGRVWSPPAHQVEVGFTTKGGVAWGQHNLDSLEGSDKKDQIIVLLGMFGKGN